MFQSHSFTPIVLLTLKVCYVKILFDICPFGHLQLFPVKIYSNLCWCNVTLHTFVREISSTVCITT